MESFTKNMFETVPCPPDVIAALSSSQQSPPPVIANDTTPELDALFQSLPSFLEEKRVELGNAPSAVLVAVQGGEVMGFGTAGSVNADGSGGAPTYHDSAYRIASITKLFTTTMLYKMRDEKDIALSLDTELAELLPGFAGVDATSPFNSTRGVSLRALATHSSGLVREQPAGGDEEEILANLAAEVGSAFMFRPFAATAYSNLGITLLGRALEKATPDESYEDYVTREILTELGMTNSGFDYSLARELLVEGVDGDGEVVVNPSTNESVWSAPCGRMYSTPHDMAQWMRFALNYDAAAGDPLGGDSGAAASGGDDANMVLDGTTLLEMQRTAVLHEGGTSGIGSGTFETVYTQGHWAATKAGCIGGYRSDVMLVPRLKLGVFAAAASTCDVLGDGDAISFPFAAKLIPAVEAALLLSSDKQQQDEQDSVPDVDGFAGQYCEGASSVNVTVEELTSTTGGPSLVLRNYDTSYPFVLRWMRWENGTTAVDDRALFRMDMLGPFLDPDITPGCIDEASGLNTCATSCNMRMARGDRETLAFVVNGDGVTGFDAQGLGFSCDKLLI